MDNIIQSAGQYGALGLTLLASFWYINKIGEDQKTEREQITDRMVIMHADALSAINNNTSVLSEIKTIISNK